MQIPKAVRQFFLPSLTPKFLIRVVLVALGAYLFFAYICIPFRIQGTSMEPTYHDGGFNFCWRWAYAFSEPHRGDVVLVRFAGQKVMLLKRVVALEGELIEFRHGTLFVNETPIEEPYVTFPCTWELSPREVKPNYVYVIGDNRNMPIELHQFGQAALIRLRGKPLW